MGAEGADLHQGPEAVSPVTGYRKLSSAEIVTMNGIKALAVEVGRLCDDLALLPDSDKRWLAIGRTQLQTGFMAVVRSVARPDTF